MKRPEFQDNWNTLMEKLSGLGEQILGKNFFPELRKRLQDLETFRCLLNFSNDAIFLVDPDSGRIEKVNETACRLLGRDRKELYEMPFAELAAEQGNEEFHAFLPGVAYCEAGEQSLSVLLLGRDGNKIPVEMTVKTMSECGEPWLVAVARDVSDRKQAEAELKDNRLKHLNTLDAIPDMLYEMAPDGTIIYANRTAAETLDISPEDLGKINFSRFLEKEEADRLRQEIRNVAENRHPSQNVSYNLKTRDGSRLPVEVHDTLLEREGQPPTILGVARDITDRKQLEERFLRSQRMEALGRLSGGIAHEYNNLMTAITGYADLMLLSLAQGDPLRKRAEEILRAGEMAQSLTRQLLAFNRKQVFQPSVLKLNEVVSDMEPMLRRLIGEDIDLVTNLDPDIGFAKTDKAQIEQAILNLTANSRDAMPDGGTVTLETRNLEMDSIEAARHVPMKPGPYVVLAFSDTGVGMGKEVQSHIFEPFFTTKEKDKGTGLGLSTVYGIVKQSGGYIWVDSQEDEGATFKVYLPRISAKDLPDQPRQPAPPPRTLDGSETILLVEDQDSIRDLVCEVLQRKGYKVLDAKNAGEAILISEQHTGLIHLMLTDMVMPRMGGRDLSERLGPWHPEMKVLYMSGCTENAMVQKGLQEPGLPFLEKPFSPEALARKVREVLNVPRNGSGDTA